MIIHIWEGLYIPSLSLANIINHFVIAIEWAANFVNI